MESSFPILWTREERLTGLAFSDSVPWAFIEPGREQAQKNHSQTLERIAQRGGLDPEEMLCAIEQRGWPPEREPSPAARLKSVLESWQLTERDLHEYWVWDAAKERATP